MTIVDHIVQAVETSDRIDAEKRAALTGFFLGNRALFETLGDEATRAVAGALAAGDADAAWQRIADSLSQEQLVQLLQATQDDMADTAKRAEAARAQLQALMDTVGAYAFKLALGALL